MEGHFVVGISIQEILFQRWAIEESPLEASLVALARNLMILPCSISQRFVCVYNRASNRFSV